MFFYVKLLGNQMIDLDVLVFDLELIEASVIVIAFEENVISNGQLDLVQKIQQFKAILNSSQTIGSWFADIAQTVLVSLDEELSFRWNSSSMGAGTRSV